MTLSLSSPPPSQSQVLWWWLPVSVTSHHYSRLQSFRQFMIQNVTRTPITKQTIINPHIRIWIKNKYYLSQGGLILNTAIVSLESRSQGWGCSVISVTGTPTRLIWANQRLVFRSHDHSRPIRGHYKCSVISVTGTHTQMIWADLANRPLPPRQNIFNGNTNISQIDLCSGEIMLSESSPPPAWHAWPRAPGTMHQFHPRHFPPRGESVALETITDFIKS